MMSGTNTVCIVNSFNVLLLLSMAVLSCMRNAVGVKNIESIVQV